MSTIEALGSWGRLVQRRWRPLSPLLCAFVGADAAALATKGTLRIDGGQKSVHGRERTAIASVPFAYVFRPLPRGIDRVLRYLSL